MVEIPETFHDLFEKPTIAHVVTLFPDGRPHSTPVWIGYDAEDERILVNTERGRQKERNVRRDSRVAVSMTYPENPYQFLSVTGEVTEITTEGAREHIDELARRYTDAEEYQNPIQTERVILRIRADELFTGP
jgi:PPOX class probable F420-dependent enzyme